MGDGRRPGNTDLPYRETSLGSDEGDSAPDSFMRAVARISEPVSEQRFALPVGATLGNGRLHVLRHLGAGGMGTVFEVFDDERGGRVAVKLLRRPDPSDVYRIKNEFRAIARLTHPSIVQLHELFAEEERWFFTMELIDGVPFTAWVRPAEKLDERRLRSGLRQLLDAVCAIHAAGSFHRDLKPSNVLVTPAGRVVVLDFGLAESSGRVGQTITEHHAIGTPAYMAPEQAAGERATSASDVYAVGVMLFEALTGRLPFEGTIGEVLIAKQLRAAPRPSEVTDQPIPPDLDALCFDMIMREPHLRPLLSSVLVRAELVDASLGSTEAPAQVDVPVRFFGRTRELQRLQDAFERTLAGQSVLVHLTGESGVGKSATCEVFLQTAARKLSAVTLEGRCFEQESIPFNAFDPLIDSITRYMRSIESASAAALLPRDAFALAQLFPVFERVEVMRHAPRRALPDSLSVRRAALVAFVELLARMRDRAPLIVHLDDVQWIDEDSSALLRQMLSHGSTTPFLLILSSRTGEHGVRSRTTGVLEVANASPAWEVCSIALEPLEHAAQAELVESMLRDSGLEPTAFVGHVVGEARGNPFLARELCTALARVPLARVSIAPSLEALLKSRVATLPSEARCLLEAVAFVGHPLSVRVGLAAVGATHDDLDRLRRDRLLRYAPHKDFDGSLKVECYHDRIREAVRSRLDPADCCKLARQLADGLIASEVDDDPDFLGRMLEEAGDDAAAASHAEKAALRAEASMAFERAAGLLRRALGLGTHSEDRVRDLSERLGQVLALAGYGSEAADAYVRAAALSPHAEALDLRRRAAEELLITGHVSEGTQLLSEVCREASVPPPSSTPHTLASLLWTSARLRLRGLQINHPKAPPSRSDLQRLALAHTMVTGLLGYLPLQAASAASHYLRMALDIGDSYHVVWALGLNAHIAQFRSPSAAWARTLVERMQEAADETERPDLIGFARTIEGAWLHTLCDFRRSRERILCALELFRTAVVNSQAVDMVHLFDEVSGYASGEHAYLATVVPERLEEAYRRNRIWAALIMSGPWGTVPVWLAPDRPDDLRRYLETANARLAAQPFLGWPNFMVVMSEVVLMGYNGEPALGSAVIDRYRRAGGRDFLAWNGPARHLVALYQGNYALAARAPKSCELARRCLAEARSCVLNDHRAAVLEAGIHYYEGHVEHAVAALRDAGRKLDQSGMKMWAAAVKRRLGQLTGGDAGRALVATSEEFMRGQGVKNLDAMTDIHVWPG